jgi:hypothetical protein
VFIDVHERYRALAYVSGCEPHTCFSVFCFSYVAQDDYSGLELGISFPRLVSF